MDKSTLSGIGLAVAGISVGLYLDGGRVGQLLQPTAALIVFGGTFGAVMAEVNSFLPLLTRAKVSPIAVCNWPTVPRAKTAMRDFSWCVMVKPCAVSHAVTCA